MILNELKFYFKKYKFITIVLYLQISLFLIISGTFLAFVNELEYESKSLQQVYEGKAIYQLLDAYYDGDKYSQFINQPDYLNDLKEYYNQLNESKDFQYLAMFNNHILLNDKRVTGEFVEGYEQGNSQPQVEVENILYTPVKSFQLNKQAVDFFNLSVSDGSLWNEKTDKDLDGNMPVILGNSYKQIYKIGDTASINYYNKLFNVKVIGFLKENSKVYFNNNTEFYLDNYFVLPYLDFEEPASENDEKFQQISYFAMINGYVVTDNDPEKTQTAMQRIDAIAQKSGVGYSYIGLNPHFQKYRGLMTVLQEDKWLVQSVFIITTSLNLLVFIITMILQQKRRHSYLWVHYINGATKKNLVISQWIEICSIIFVAYLTAFIILSQILKIGDLLTYAFLFLLSFLISVIVCAFPGYQILSKSFLDRIDSENEGDK